MPKDSRDILISATDINLRLGGRPILQNVSLTLQRSRALTLIGPNGAGKTTLVRVLLGLLRPDRGEVHRADGLRIGYMPQRLHIEPTLPLTVDRFLQLPGRQTEARVLETLEQTRIVHLRGQSMGSLSGGETQRVLLARALLRSPDLLVLDEPAQGVDVSGQAELYELIGTLQSTYHCGVLMISHDLHLVMANTDEVVCLNQHICCQGKPEHVSTDPSYLELFGKRDAEALAIYTHHHNHSHDVAGDIIEAKDD
ncbi:MAG: zinc ABC transporter ATP-binding protein ZnuC [Pseudohongiellaceae bacterium]